MKAIQKEAMEAIRPEIPEIVWDHPMEGQVRHYSFENLGEKVEHLPLVVRREEFVGGIDTGLHEHDDFCTLYFVEGGEGRHLVGGQSYNVMSGDIYIISPGTNHGFQKYHAVRMYGVYFPLDLLSKAEISLLRRTSLWKVLAATPKRRRRAVSGRRLHLLPQQYREAEAMVAEIYEEVNKPPMGPLLARYLLFRLLATLSRWYEERLLQRRGGISQELPAASVAGNEIGQSHAATLKQLIGYCEVNLDRPLTVNHLAARMFLSTSQFSRLFAREVGMPPASYVRQLRLAQAQRLLANSVLPIAEIAIACGLRDAARLSHAFRDAFGITPSRYRKMHRTGS